MAEVTDQFKRPRGRPVGTGKPMAPHGRTSHGPGAAQFRTEAYIKNIVDTVIESGVELPLIWLMKQYHNEALDMGWRIDCAKAVMPYIHRRRPVEVEMTETPQTNILTLNVTADRLKDLSDDELGLLKQLAQRITPPRLGGSGAPEAEAVEAEQVLSGQGTTTEGALPEASRVLPEGFGKP